MSGRSKLSLVDFWEELMSIEGQLARNKLATIHELFRNFNDELFALLHLRDFDGFQRIKQILPTWPSEQFWMRTMGNSSPNDSLKEACAFWEAVKGDYLHLTGSSISNTSIADFGAGWGRITRLFAKDVPSERLWGIDPNDEFREEFVSSGVQAQIVTSDWDSLVPLALKDIGLIVSFGVFSHASALLARNMFERLGEISKPGTVLAITVRPGAMLYTDQGEANLLSSEALAQARQDYLEGKHIFIPYAAGAQWGVAVAPNASLKSMADPWFRYLHQRPLIQNWTQKVVYLMRT